MESLALILVAIVAVPIAARLYSTWRARSQTDLGSAQELQSYLSSCVDDLRELLGHDDIELISLAEQTDAVLTRMESRNIGGNLDALIQDNRQAVSQAIAKRRASHDLTLFVGRR